MTTTHDPIDEICGATWQYTGAQQDANCTPLDLMGATVQWRLDSADGTTNIAARTNASGGGIQILDFTNAVVLVTVPAAVSANIPPGNYVDWLIVTLQDGTVLYQWTGVIRAAAKPA